MQPVEVEPGEGRLAGRIEDVGVATEFGRATPSNCLDEIGIAVVDEVGERRRLGVLLAHEQQRDERREQQRSAASLARGGWLDQRS